MPTPKPAHTDLAGWLLVSLRPRGQHAGLRRAAAAWGARVLALSPLRIEARAAAATRQALRAAAAAELVVFTSPNAVRAAAALQPLRSRRGQHWLALGAGSAAALRRAGIDAVASPTRMDSDGLLAMPALHALDGKTVGLVTAPGGRDRLAAALRGRGAQLRRADVYTRIPCTPNAAAVARLAAHRAPLLLALSSGEALLHALAQLPDAAVARLQRARVLAASPRLADLARAHGFGDIVLATSAQPRDLLASAAAAAPAHR
jgi:uroporphyrinogen-III synthase